MKKVNELEDEERRNQLKWQVKLGESIIDEQTRQEILSSRAQAVYEYKVLISSFNKLFFKFRRKTTI